MLKISKITVTQMTSFSSFSSFANIHSSSASSRSFFFWEHYCSYLLLFCNIIHCRYFYCVLFCVSYILFHNHIFLDNYIILLPHRTCFLHLFSYIKDWFYYSFWLHFHYLIGENHSLFLFGSRYSANNLYNISFGYNRFVSSCFIGS